MQQPDATTKLFFELTPDRILRAVETVGVRCTGRVLQLNSMENRVYEVEVDLDSELPRNAAERFRIVKFYRPGRWTQQQIQEEHDFLFDLQKAEVPAIAPLLFVDGKSIATDTDTGIFFTIFPKQGGRSPDELDDEMLVRVGRLLARMHAVGSARQAPHRMKLTAENFAQKNFQYLLEAKAFPLHLEKRFEQAVAALVKFCEPRLAKAVQQRIHGDCHFGNLILGREGLCLVDFDDMLVGPPVQDVWLLLSGRDDEGNIQRDLLLSGYEEMRAFDRSTLPLIEGLRALRYIHYAAWIHRRWSDPYFPRAFPHFGTQAYWEVQIVDVEEQVRLVSQF